jgi:hypothetical protein
MQEAKRAFVSLNDASFARLYRERLAPVLAACDDERPPVLQKSRYLFWLQVSGCAVVGALAYFVSGALSLGFFIALFAFVVLYAATPKPLVKAAAEVRSKTFSILADAEGCTFKPDGFDPDIYRLMHELGFLQGNCSKTFRERFAGRCRGRDFSFFWAHLVDGSGDDSRVTFEGQLICIEFPHERFRAAVVRSDKATIANLADLARVVWRAARPKPPVATAAEPAPVRRVRELQRKLAGRNLRVGFKDGKLLIAAESIETESAVWWRRLLKRSLAYESFRQAGVSVDTAKAAAIEKSLSEEDPATDATMDAPLNSLARARAITAEVRETLRLIDSVLETAP